MQLNLIDAKGNLQNKETIEAFLLESNPQQKAMATLSIFGSQSSGKSTLLNDLFSLSLKTLAQGLSKKRTTQGVDIQLKEVVDGKVVLCIDNEGTDSVERAYSNEGPIEQSIGTLSCAVSQIVILNQWFNELSRNAANSYPVIENMFKIYLTQLKDKQDDKKVVIYFVIRDSELQDDIQKEEAIKMIQNNIMTIFTHANSEVQFDDYFIMKFSFLSHRIYRREVYDQEIAQLRNDLMQLLEFSKPDYDVFSKLVNQLWKLITRNEEINIYKLKDQLIEQKIKQNISIVSDKFQKLLNTSINELENTVQNTFVQVQRDSSITKYITNVEDTFALAKVLKYIENNQINNIINQFLHEDEIMQQLMVQMKDKAQLYTSLTVQYQYYTDKVIKIISNFTINMYTQIINELKDKFTLIEPNVQLFGRNEQLVININLLFKYVNHLFQYKQDPLDIEMHGQKELSSSQHEILDKNISVISTQLKQFVTIPILMNVQEININIQSLTLTLSEIAEALFLFQYYFIQKYLKISQNSHQELQYYENMITFIKSANYEYTQAMQFFQEKIVKINEKQVQIEINDMMSDLKFDEITNQTLLSEKTERLSNEAQQLLEIMLCNILNYKYSIHSEPKLNYLFTTDETTQYYDIEELLKTDYKYCNTQMYLDISKTSQINLTQSITTNESRIKLIESDLMNKINEIEYISLVDEVSNFKHFIDKSVNAQLKKIYKEISTQRLESYGYQIYFDAYEELKRENQNVTVKQLKETQNNIIKNISLNLDKLQKTEIKGLSLDQRSTLINQVNNLFNRQIEQQSCQTNTDIPKWVWILMLIIGRNDLMAILRNKLILTFVLIISGYLYYLHKTKDLNQLVELINKSGIKESIKSGNIQQINDNSKQLKESIKQWLK